MTSLQPSPPLHIKTCLLWDEVSIIRQIRDRVFGEEQGIPVSLDWDGRDEQAIHLVAFFNTVPVGVARMREISLGLKLERLAVLPAYRQQGIGSAIVETAIAYARLQRYPCLKLHAQLPTVSFYQALGFESSGQPFQEAGLPHIAMQQSIPP